MSEKNTNLDLCRCLVNLFIVGMAILLVIHIRDNSNSKQDSFSSLIPGNYRNYEQDPRDYNDMSKTLAAQPIVYPNQFYPVKYPYYNDTIKQVGRPCDSSIGCGVLGACKDGVCSIKKEQTDTVFNVKL